MIFLRLIAQVLHNVSDLPAVFLDDIVFQSASWEEQLRHAHAGLDCLHSAGLTINPFEYVFAAAETEYLGHIIGNELIEPQVNNVDDIESCPLPKTRKQLGFFWQASTKFLHQGSSTHRLDLVQISLSYPVNGGGGGSLTPYSTTSWVENSTLDMAHKAFQWMGRMKDSDRRITLWYMALQPFRFSIQHIPGKDNPTADYLSCCFSES